MRARGEAQNLLSLQSGIATLIDADGTRGQVTAHALRPGDRLLVAAGERCRADGVVRSGHRRSRPSLITGETAPVQREAGRRVYAGTLNLTRPLEIEVTAADSATLLAEISRLMLAAEQGKARYRRLADRAAQIYAPAVHSLGLATFLGWLMLGASWHTALTYAIAVLIITCPCALALAVPAVQIAAASRLFRQDVIVKTPDGLERIADIDLVVFDKTGTLTLGGLSKSLTIGFPTISWRQRRGSPPEASTLMRAQLLPRRRGSWVPSCRLSGRGGFRKRARGAPTQGEERLGSAGWCGFDSEGEDSEVWYRRGGGPRCASVSTTLSAATRPKRSRR